MKLELGKLEPILNWKFTRSYMWSHYVWKKFFTYNFDKDSLEVLHIGFIIKNRFYGIYRTDIIFRIVYP